MKQTAIAFLLTSAALLVPAHPTAAACESDGEVQFICGPVNPEDFAALPDSPWVPVSSWTENGQLHLANSRDHTTTVLHPTSVRHDTATYGACPGPLPSQFQPHGLYLRPGSGETHTLLVVRHGGRETIEVFEVEMGDGTPTLPRQLTAKEVFRYPSNDLLVLGTVAIQVGSELWVGGIVGGERIARVPAPL